MTCIDFALSVAPKKKRGSKLEEERTQKQQCRKEREKKELACLKVREPVCLTVVAMMIPRQAEGLLLQSDLLENLLATLLHSDLLEALLATRLQSNLLEALLATLVFGISRKCIRRLYPLHLGE